MDQTDNSLAASAAERWRRIGEAAEIPGDHREILRGLLAREDGATTGTVAEAAGVSRWTARTYLERLRNEGLARIEGEKRQARWRPGVGSVIALPLVDARHEPDRRRGHQVREAVGEPVAVGFLPPGVNPGDVNRALGDREARVGDGPLAGRHAGIVAAEDVAGPGVEQGGPLERHGLLLPARSAPDPRQDKNGPPRSHPATDQDIPTEPPIGAPE